MRHLSIALGGVFALALCSQALADPFNPQPDPPGHTDQTKTPAFNPQPDPPGRSGQDCGFERSAPGSKGMTAQGSGAGSGKETDRKAGGQQVSVGSATGGAGAGKTPDCVSGQH